MTLQDHNTVEKAQDSLDNLNQKMSVSPLTHGDIPGEACLPPASNSAPPSDVAFLEKTESVILGFLGIDQAMSLPAAATLLLLYRRHLGKAPCAPAEIAELLQMSPSTVSRLMYYLGQGKEDVGFIGLDYVDLRIDRKDRRRRNLALNREGVKAVEQILQAFR